MNRRGQVGYIVFGDSQWFGPGVRATMTAGNVWVWNQTTTDNSALHRATSPTSRLAACAYASEYIELQFDWAANETHRIGIYCLDWSLHGRAQTIEVIQNGAAYPAQTVSAFGEGEYLVWEVTGPCKMRVNRTAGPNAVISGVFIDGKGGAGSSPVSFVGFDADTKGSWKGVYGSGGYAIPADGAAATDGLTITAQGAGTHIWAYRITDVEALQMANADERIASCWYGPTFDIAVAVNNGATRNVGLYLLDWDAANRAVRVDVVNPNTGATMDRRIVTEFADGIWARWTLSGSVVFRITSMGGPNAVVSGAFVD